MKIKIVTKLVLFIFLSPVALFTQEVQFDVPALLREAKTKSDENWRRVIAEHPNFSYKWRKSWRKKDRNGNIKEHSELYELFFPAKCPDKKCPRASVLLARDGKDLAPEKIAEQRMEAGRKIEKMENRADARVNSPDPAQPLYWMYFGFYRRTLFDREPELIAAINGQEILETCQFFSPVREDLKGHKTIAVSFRPRPDAVFSEYTRYMSQMEGRFWIDESAGLFIALAIWKQGTKFEWTTHECLFAHADMVQEMENTGRGWFPGFARINGLEHPGLFGDIKEDFSIEQFDHHYFKTEVKKVEIEAPTEQ